ncbi:hypothetical protein, partial [Vibrio parahaemolyticus]|uniref:hypothetical protein n=1 Tax=Vibrio parahaemolyticus TaxID=670 RepID=UPI00344CAB6C
ANRQHTYDQDLPTSGRIGQKIHLSNSIPFASFRCNFDNLANALLRCEQRNTDAAANHLKHKTQRIVKMPCVANHS